MLLEASAVADPATVAGTAFGTFLNGLAASGSVGGLVAAALGALVVISGWRLYLTARTPLAAPQVTVIPTPEASAAAALAAPPPPSAAVISDLTDRMQRVEGRVGEAEERLDGHDAWHVEHAHRHEVDEVAAKAREEGAREERERAAGREQTNPGRRR